MPCPVAQGLAAGFGDQWATVNAAGDTYYGNNGFNVSLYGLPGGAALGDAPGPVVINENFAIAIGPDGKVYNLNLHGSSDLHLERWSTGGSLELDVTVLSGVPFPATSLTYSWLDDQLYAVLDFNHIYRVDPITGATTLVTTAPNYDQPVPVFQPDGTVWITQYNHGPVIIFDLATFATITTLTLDRSCFPPLLPTASGGALVVDDTDGFLWQIDPTTGATTLVCNSNGFQHFYAGNSNADWSKCYGNDGSDIWLVTGAGAPARIFVGTVVVR